MGNLWSSTGTLLATATFTGETGSVRVAAGELRYAGDDERQHNLRGLLSRQQRALQHTRIASTKHCNVLFVNIMWRVVYILGPIEEGARGYALFYGVGWGEAGAPRGTRPHGHALRSPRVAYIQREADQRAHALWLMPLLAAHPSARVPSITTIIRPT